QSDSRLRPAAPAKHGGRVAARRGETVRVSGFLAHLPLLVASARVAMTVRTTVVPKCVSDPIESGFLFVEPPGTRVPDSSHRGRLLSAPPPLCWKDGFDVLHSLPRPCGAATPSCLHADRAAGGHRDHCGAHRPLAAGGPEGPRGGQPHVV